MRWNRRATGKREETFAILKNYNNLDDWEIFGKKTSINQFIILIFHEKFIRGDINLFTYLF
jgi:hypothetical protein